MNELVKEIQKKVVDGTISDYKTLEKYKMQLSKKYKTNIPKNSEILENLDGETRSQSYPFLTRKPSRTLSGVAVVAVMTSPSKCPHGKCIYCPGGVDYDTAQSYTGREPAALRAIQNHYDPYLQTEMRIKQLEKIGHSTSKLDLIIMGGTFTARDSDYQTHFIKRSLDYLNHEDSKNLNDAILKNETARHRVIGLTVETRPDWFFEQQIDKSLSYGTTRVELGVQNTDDEILNFVNRAHGQKEIIKSTQLSKDAGLKVGYHMMPGLPNSNMTKDLESFTTIFSNPDYKPDLIKIYPTLVVKGTKLYELWKDGKYVPYSTEDMIKLLREIKNIVPPWVRIQRVQRDIPVQLIEDGVKRSDVRALALSIMKQHGEKCRCIRCREIGHKIREKEITAPMNIEQNEIKYHASGGTEYFISYEDTNNDALIGYLRLRFVSIKAHRPELTQDSTIVRELKVLGPEVPVHKNYSFAFQHKGFGKGLMDRAEDIARQVGMKYMLVNSGMGVRDYYRKLGYEQFGAYMKKVLRL